MDFCLDIFGAVKNFTAKNCSDSFNSSNKGYYTSLELSTRNQLVFMLVPCE